MRSKLYKFEGEVHVAGCPGELGKCMGVGMEPWTGGWGPGLGSGHSTGTPPCGQTDMIENITFASL